MVMEIGRVKISGAALTALAAAYFFDSGVLFAAAIAAAVHEAGHFAALRILGRRITELRLELWGLTMRCEGHLSYQFEIITAAAGPAASLLLAIAASLTGRFCASQEAYLISGVSFVYCVFNTLPVMPLDGGKILHAAAALIVGIEKAERIACVVSCAGLFALLAAGAILLYKTKVNFTLLLAAIWLLISYCKKNGVSIKSKRKIMEVKHG
jgi:stage IV sporulation protein FB